MLPCGANKAARKSVVPSVMALCEIGHTSSFSQRELVFLCFFKKTVAFFCRLYYTARCAQKLPIPGCCICCPPRQDDRAALPFFFTAGNRLTKAAQGAKTGNYCKNQQRQAYRFIHGGRIAVLEKRHIHNGNFIGYFNRAPGRASYDPCIQADPSAFPGCDGISSGRASGGALLPWKTGNTGAWFCQHESSRQP